jgi:hypothetical protein
VNSIESMLGDALGPVRAPGELWDRVNGTGARKAGVDHRLAWAMAAAVVVVGLLSFGRGDAIRSSEPAAVRAWVLARTGADVPLAGGEVVGARMRRGTVEIDYRAGTLMVTRASGAGADSAHWVRADYQGRSSFSWVMGGQSYTLACAVPGDLEAGCRLCHAEGVVN